MSHLLRYTYSMHNMKNEKANNALWNKSHLVATYPHTRDGYDAAMEQAHNLTIGGYGKLTIFSSRDDLVWSSTSDDEPQPYDGWEGSWAGDGSGMDDLADFNSMEGNDY